MTTATFALLLDGSTVEIRPATPDDAEAVRAMHAALSPENAYLRFFSLSPLNAGREARRVCREPGPDHAALLAWLDGELAGVASYETAGQPGTAEIAFAVPDHLHHRGIATLLLEHLVSIARQRKVEVFTAETLTASLRRRFCSRYIARELSLPISSSDVHRKHDSLAGGRTYARSASTAESARTEAALHVERARPPRPAPRNAKRHFSQSLPADRPFDCPSTKICPPRAPRRSPQFRAYMIRRASFASASEPFAPRRRHSRATISPKRSTAAFSWLGDSQRTNSPNNLTIAPCRSRMSAHKRRISAFAIFPCRFLHARMLPAAIASVLQPRIADSHPPAFRIELWDCASTKSAAVVCAAHLKPNNEPRNRGAHDSRQHRDPENSAAPLSVPAGRRHRRNGTKEAHCRNQERHHQRAFLSGPLSRQAGHAGRADH